MIIEFLTHEANAPYFFALCILVLLFAFEIAGMLIGMSLSHAFDSVIDFDADTDVGGHLSILGLGKVPLIVWLTFLLGVFAIFGYALNAITSSFIGYTPIWLSASLVGVLAFVINGVLCRIFAKAFPKYETTVVSIETFSGRIATVTVGNATNADFAMGVVKDEHNHSHNVRIQTMDDGVVCQEGTQVILVERIKDSAIWLAIPYEN